MTYRLPMLIISELTVGRASKALGSTSRIIGPTRILGVLLLVLLHNPVQAAQSVTLAWDRSADPTVVSYNIYHGAASGNYTNIVNVGNSTNATIPGLIEGTTKYFTVTALNSRRQ